MTPEQKEEYVKERQSQKTKERKNMPERVLVYNPTYPWMTEGVNDTNREQWQKMIAKKNSWLCLGVV